MKNKILISLLIIFLLALTLGCSSKQGVVCNKPYLLVGNSCCLDQNDNQICDIDEKTTQPAPVTTTIENNNEKDKEEIIKISKQLSASTISDDYSLIYSLLTPERQSYKTKDEFITLCQEFYYPSGVTSFIVDKNNIFIEKDEAQVNFKISQRGNNFDETYNFKKVGDKWLLDGYGFVIFAGCITKEQCEKSINQLTSKCENTCKGDITNKVDGATVQSIFNKDTDPFVCSSQNICQCHCEDTISGKSFYKDVKY